MCIKPIDLCESFAYNNFVDLQKNIIRGSGLRITPARVAILKILDKATQPIDISTITTSVATNKLIADQATIYRIIESFLEKKIINKFQFQEKKFYYEINRADHHHAICTKCGKIEDISNCSIKRTESRINEKFGFKVSHHSLEFFGLCASCQAQ